MENINQGEITVLDGMIELVGNGFVKYLEASTIGSCKLVVPLIHSSELINTSQAKSLKLLSLRERRWLEE